MANNLDKFYNMFTGLDTRSNKMLQAPGSFRAGSKNFRYNFQDEIQNANGFQRKDSGSPNFVDIFEYKYRDVNTGESKAEVLGVSTTGYLYRRKLSVFKFDTHGAATSVSVIYDEVDLTFKMVLAGLGSVNISDTMTLAQLETAVEALAGVTVTITGDNSKLAYLLDCVVEDKNFSNNDVYYWEMIPYPDIVCVSATSVTEANLDMSNPAQFTFNSVPFPTTVKAQNPTLYPDIANEYEGISSINLNNSIYITDGGFMMKYDGKVVYRAGVPTVYNAQATTRTISVSPWGSIGPGTNISGISSDGITPPTNTNALPNGTYKYKYRYGFTDFNGATTYGSEISLENTITVQPNPSVSNNFQIINRGFRYGKDFPVFSAVVNGNQGFETNGDGITFNVYSGHNILPGMVIRQYTNTGLNIFGRSTSKSKLNFYAKVTAVTATSITIQQKVGSAADPPVNSEFKDFEVINAYYVNDYLVNKRPYDTFSNSVLQPAGAFLEIYRTKVGQVNGPYYRVFQMSVPMQNVNSSIIDELPDANLIENFEDQEIGDLIPRAGKLVSQWQNNLIQAGRTPDSSLKDKEYPSIFYTDNPSFAPDYQPRIDTISRYNENYLCDFQSVYWADALTPEGFPQDGLHEFAIDTKFSDKITAISPNKDAFFAFKERSTAVLSGDVALNEIVMEVLETDAGCISHRTVEEIRGALVWLDKNEGFFSCVAGRLPENIGFPIQDFQKINKDNLDYKKATGANFNKESLYVCAVGNTTFVFDYADNGSLNRNCWYLWDRINTKSILSTSDDKLLLFDGTNTLKMKTTNTKYDFSDHKSAIPFVLNTSWITQGFPTIDKHYLNLWINSIQGDFTLTVKQFGNFLADTIGRQDDVVFIPENSSKKFVKQPVKAYYPKLSAISFGMENSQINKFVRIQGYEVQYSPDYNTGEPKR